MTSLYGISLWSSIRKTEQSLEWAQAAHKKQLHTLFTGQNIKYLAVPEPAQNNYTLYLSTFPSAFPHGLGEQGSTSHVQGNGDPSAFI